MTLSSLPRENIAFPRENIILVDQKHLKRLQRGTADHNKELLNVFHITPISQGFPVSTLPVRVAE